MSKTQDTTNPYALSQYTEKALESWIKTPAIYANCKLIAIEQIEDEYPRFKFTFETNGEKAESTLFYKVDAKAIKGKNDIEKAKKALQAEQANIRFLVALLLPCSDKDTVSKIVENSYDALIKRLWNAVSKIYTKGVYNIKVIAKPNKDGNKYCTVPANAGAVEGYIAGQSPTIAFSEYEKENGFHLKESIAAPAKNTPIMATLPPLASPFPEAINKTDSPKEDDLPF